MADVIRAQQGDTLAALLWRERKLGPDAWNTVLEANPGLARHGSILPRSTPVIVPETANVAPRTLPLIQLWD